MLNATDRPEIRPLSDLEGSTVSQIKFLARLTGEIPICYIRHGGSARVLWSDSSETELPQSAFDVESWRKVFQKAIAAQTEKSEEYPC